jgi:hypothetical protein
VCFHVLHVSVFVYIVFSYNRQVADYGMGIGGHEVA